MPLDEKSRLKLDKVFMAFGSLMKAGDERLRGPELKQYADEAWAWAIRNVYQVVDELYQMSAKQEEKAGPQSPPPPKSQEVLGETDIITVKGVTLQKQGTNKNGAWKLYKITDQFDHNYFTFHTSFQIGETYEVDWEWKIDGEKKWRTIPHTPRPVGERAEYDDREDIPF